MLRNIMKFSLGAPDKSQICIASVSSSKTMINDTHESIYKW
jgi:hypothetical protein